MLLNLPVFLSLITKLLASGTSNSPSISNSTNSTVTLSYYEKIKPSFPDNEKFLIDASRIDLTTINLEEHNLNQCLQGITVNSTNILACFYQKYADLLASNYSIDIPSPDEYYISIYVNPCVGQTEELCEGNASPGTLSDEYAIKATNDLLVAWYMNNYIFQCGNEFKDLDSCGTFLEIHRPFDVSIIEDVRLSKNSIEKIEFTYLSTKKLCAGKYEIWFVFRTRIGNILQYIKPFFVEFPGCSCDVIAGIITGYSC